MTDLNKIIERLETLRDNWRRDALAVVPRAYAERGLAEKYLRGDCEAAGQYACADELDDVIHDLLKEERDHG